jgi:hypothetical protein
MNCKDFLARHSDYHDGLLEADAAGELRSHATRCPSCARYDAVVRRGTELARQLLPTVELSADFEARMRHRLYHERDAVRGRSAGMAGVYVTAASVVFVAAVAGLLAVGGGRTPTVEGQVVFAAAPPAMTSIAANSLVVASAPSLPPAVAPAADPVAPIEADAKGHDPHVASPAGWPVYSRSAAAVAFPASHATLVARPADFRPIASRARVAPILIRH